MGEGRELNETLMRHVASTWRTDQRRYFDRVDVFPTAKEDRILGHFVASHYPSAVESARVELRLRLNGDLNLRYTEEWPGERWACQWDRHENPQSAYEHFHVPPTVRSDDTADVRYPEPPFGVVQVGFEFVEDRVGDLWDGTLTYPSSYTFEWEYGPDIRV